jgi:hypothetical protein
VRRSQNPTGRPAADAAALSALVDNIRTLRLTLAADLAVAAAAIEAGEPAIAQEILTADRLEVRRLSSQTSLESRQAGRRKRRRVILALPAVPLIGALAMTGAAALTAHDSGRPRAASQRTIVAPRPLADGSPRRHVIVPTIERPLEKAAASQPLRKPAATGERGRQMPRPTTVSPTPTATPTSRPKAPPLIRIGQQLLDPWQVQTPAPTPTTRPLSALAPIHGVL